MDPSTFTHEKLIWTGAGCGAFFLLGVWMFFSSFRSMRLRRLISDTPTSRVRSAAMGKVELKGKALPLEAPLVAPFSAAACVWFHSKVEEEQERRDAKGRTHRVWVTLEEKYSGEPFLLDDGTGQVRVEPGGAQVEAPMLFQYVEGSFFSRNLQLAKGPEALKWIIRAPGGFWGSFSRVKKVRLSEWRIDPSMKLYLLGVLTNRRVDSRSRVQVEKGAQDEPYVITSRTEEEILRSLSLSFWGKAVFGALFTMASVGFASFVFLDPWLQKRAGSHQAAPAPPPAEEPAEAFGRSSTKVW